MPSITEKVSLFRDLHQPGRPFIIPNPWDAGSARILEGLGYKALATTSSGFALTLGRRDYGVSRDEALAHARALSHAVEIPVSADLENGFGPDPEDTAETIRLAATTGLAGGSIEDSTGDEAEPVFGRAFAVARIAAAAQAAHASPNGFVLTARAEAYLYGRGDLGEIIERLNAFAEAGADILYAPGLPDLDAVKTVCSSVPKPVNVLIYGKLAEHRLEEFAEAGAARLSIGGGLAWPAYGALAEIAEGIRAGGDFSGLKNHAAGAAKARKYLR
jgi:2-methylisocitrate lyase-like PEP mutase family enzyme